MSKDFESLKKEFMKITLSNEQLTNDLKNSTPLRNELEKARHENEKLSQKILNLKSSISKFKKGKDSPINLLDS